jgi:hypothetical protein
MCERRVWCAGIVASTLLWGVGWGTPSPRTADLDRLLPVPSSLEGWRTAEGPTEYLPDTLWEYLDGGAPRYVSYGFRRLIHVRYEGAGDPHANVTLDVFDMGGELGAFGIYRSSLPQGEPLRRWGAEGHRSGTVAAAWKAGVFVHSEADDERPELVAMTERLVAMVCDAVPGEPSLPSILDVLPREGRIPRSERYVAEDLLGHAFLPRGVLATYEVGGHEARLFFSDAGSEAAAGEAMSSLRAHEEKWGAVVQDTTGIGDGGFRFSDPGLGSGMAVRTGRFVAGVHGDAPLDEQGRLLARLVEGLASSATK